MNRMARRYQSLLYWAPKKAAPAPVANVAAFTPPLLLARRTRSR